MIQSYTKYKQFKSLVDTKENGKAVRSGLDFLCFVAEEYSRLEMYNNQIAFASLTISVRLSTSDWRMRIHTVQTLTSK